MPFQPGDMVVYHMSKISEHPGPRAQGVKPAEHGETYSYVVDKFWRVVEIAQDGSLVLTTRRGKVHRVRPDDPNLRRPTWWQRFWHRHRFPPLPS